MGIGEMEMVRFSLLFSSVELKSLNPSDVPLRTNAHSIYCVCVSASIIFVFFCLFEHINHRKTVQSNCVVHLTQQNTHHQGTIFNYPATLCFYCVPVRRRLPRSASWKQLTRAVHYRACVVCASEKLLCSARGLPINNLHSVLKYANLKLHSKDFFFVQPAALLPSAVVRKVKLLIEYC